MKLSNVADCRLSNLLPSQILSTLMSLYFGVFCCVKTRIWAFTGNLVGKALEVLFHYLAYKFDDCIIGFVSLNSILFRFNGDVGGFLSFLC